jgi:hypothetical protein
MIARQNFRLPALRKALVIVGAILIAWALYGLKAETTAAPDEPRIERIYS